MECLGPLVYQRPGAPGSERGRQVPSSLWIPSPCWMFNLEHYFAVQNKTRNNWESSGMPSHAPMTKECSALFFSFLSAPHVFGMISNPFKPVAVLLITRSTPRRLFRVWSFDCVVTSGLGHGAWRCTLRACGRFSGPAAFLLICLDPMTSFHF